MVAEYKKIKKGSHRENIFFSVVLGILVVGVIGFLVISNFKISQKRTKLENQLAFLRSQVQVLEQRKAELEAGISYQKSEEYLEEVARDVLNLKKSGEEVVVITKEEKEAGAGLEEGKSFFNKFLDPIRYLSSNGVKKLKFW